MNYEKSCGIIPAMLINGEIHYILIKQVNDSIGFPKGHVQEGESEEETAHRECLEETGLDVEIKKGYRKEIQYLVKNNTSLKTVVYFIGKVNDLCLQRQETEILDIMICKYDEAISLITFDNVREILKEVDGLIKQTLR